MPSGTKDNRNDGWHADRRFFMAFAVFCASPAAAFDKPWSDVYNGLALSGYDAVSYYENDGPLPGKREFEVDLGGAYWRFHNEGNREAFKRNPDLYAPQFGGYDPVLMLEDHLTAGHPLLWRRLADKLYLFYSDKHMATFDSATESILERARRAWPKMKPRF